MGIALGLGLVFGVRATSNGRELVAALLALALTTALAVGPRTSRPLLMFALGGVVIGSLVGLLHESATAAPFTIGERLRIVATVTDDPELSAGGATAHVRWTDTNGIARESIAWLPATPPVARGDRVELYGSVRDVRAETIYVDAARIVEPRGWLAGTRQQIRAEIERAVISEIPGSPGSLALGLLVGDDSGLTEDERHDLRASGLSHLTAVSGWNVTLVIGAVGSLLLALGWRGRLSSTLQLAALAMFVWIVGPDPPVVRAALMGVAGIVALRLGRPAHAATLLTLAAALMALHDPSTLDSISFRLSVLATVGMLLAARSTRRLEGWRAVLLVPVATTVLVSALTAPVQMVAFRSIVPAAIPANLLAAPLAPLAATAAAVTAALAPIPVASDLAGAAGWLVGSALLMVARMAATLPFAQVALPPLADDLLLVFYLALGAFVFLLLPEGRWAARRLAGWSGAEPRTARVAAGGFTFAVLMALVLV